jgi:uncharacterized protein YhaN
MEDWQARAEKAEAKLETIMGLMEIWASQLDEALLDAEFRVQWDRVDSVVKMIDQVLAAQQQKGEVTT